MLSLLTVAMLLVNCGKEDTPTPNAPEMVFFKVSDGTEQSEESFILALDDPDEIEQARQIIADPVNSTEKIVSAKIIRQDGAEAYPNKDVNSGTEWSWRIDEFQGFVGLTAEILDGWPGYIEEDLDRWFQNTGGDTNHGFIGLWGYTVVEELTSDDLD